MINQSEISIYLKDIRSIKIVSLERENEIFNLIQDGNLNETQIEELKKELIIGNLKFVISIAKKYQNIGLDIPDLISEGNIGLISAMNHFDYKKGVRFITYASYWIKESIIKSVNENSRLVRLPVNVIKESIRKKPLEESNIIENKQFKVVNDDLLSDVIPGDESDIPGYSLYKNDILNILNTLDERERFIIISSFGLQSEPKTLEEISKHLNISKERVNQIKQKSLIKLKSNINI
jgi:RNA polymerase primary sigma factor